MKVSRRSRTSRLTFAGVAALAIAMAGLVFNAGPAMAHAGYESSTPADGEVVAESPETVEIVFSQEVRRSGGLPEAFVVNESGDTVSLESNLSDEDRHVVTIEMATALPDGRYTVIWHTLSDEDGEESQGAFHYYVGEGPGDNDGGEPTDETPVPTATPDAPDADDGGGDDGVPVWALIVAIVAAGFVAGGVGVAIGRASGG